MTPKKFFFIQAFSLLSVFLFLSGLIYIVDPWGRFSLIKKIPSGSNPRFYNASRLRYESYNSLILGSSMVNGFSISQVENKLNWDNSIKITTDSLLLHEEFYQLKLATIHGFNNVLLSLDTFNLFYIHQIYEFNYGKKFNLYLEEFNKAFLLYEEKLYSTFSYLFDYKSSLYYLTSVKYDNNKNLLEAEPFDKKGDYGIKKIKERLKMFNVNFKKFKFPPYWREALKENLEFNLLSIIKENPDKKFYIFMPPISILDWKMFEVDSIINYEFKKEILDLFLPYPNVYFYDFQIYWEIISNLDNYADTAHYTRAKNSWILDQIADPKNRLTYENRDKYLEKVKEWAQKVAYYEIPDDLKEFIQK